MPSTPPAGTWPRWLVKQEPDAYSFEAFLADGRTDWTGVRNYQARNNLAAMQVGELVAYYHSNIGLEVVGLAQVTRTAYPDPTVDPSDPQHDKWVCVELVPYARLRQPVTLAQLKADARTANMALIRQGRLSVCPLTDAEAQGLLTLAGGLAPLGQPLEPMQPPPAQATASKKALPKLPKAAAAKKSTPAKTAPAKKAAAKKPGATQPDGRSAKSKS